MTSLSKWVGRTETRRDVVTKGALDRYLAVIGGDAAIGAPPGFHWTLCTPDVPQSELSVDGHAEKGDFLPPVPLPRRMWAASEVEFHGGIEPGADIERQSTIASVKEKTGKSGALVFVEVAHDTIAGGALAVRERQTIVYRGGSDAPAPLPKPRGADLSSWQDVESITPDEVLLFRFSALTFNAHRIHYDRTYAQGVEHYPALLVHGPLMASLLLRLAARRGPVKTFSFRAVSPAFCGQPLHLAANWSNGEGVLAAIGGDGRTIIDAHAALS